MEQTLFVIRGVGHLMAFALFWRAYLSARDTTLSQTLFWASIAWAAWFLVFVFRSPDGHSVLGPYLACCLTACALIAVLGARRPGVGAWNFVLLGLLAVLLLPVAEGLGTPRLQTAHYLFLAGSLFVGTVDYLGTSLWLGAVLLGVGCGLELWHVRSPTLGVLTRELGAWAVTLAPWAAFMVLTLRGRPPYEFDRAWLNFRDRYGVLWAHRLRDQFNKALANSGHSAWLAWSGLRSEESNDELLAKALELLDAVMKRFGVRDED